MGNNSRHQSATSFQKCWNYEQNPIFTFDEESSFRKVMSLSIAACTDLDETTELRRIAHAYLIFDTLTSLYRASKPQLASDNPTDDYVKKAIYYMESNYSSTIKISDVAAHIGLNRSYFFSIFKEQVHLSPQEYLTRLRMAKACELFSFPNSTVTSVANSLHYEPSVFFRHFKRIIGESPSEYKKRLVREAGGTASL